MAYLLSYRCICQYAWVREYDDLASERCAACSHYPVFPHESEEIGEQNTQGLLGIDQDTEDLPDNDHGEGDSY